MTMTGDRQAVTALVAALRDESPDVRRAAIASLLELVPASRILFGTDFPPGGTNQALRTAIAELGFFNDAALRAIERDNAVRLLPRLAAAV